MDAVRRRPCRFPCAVRIWFLPMKRRSKANRRTECRNFDALPQGVRAVRRFDQCRGFGRLPLAVALAHLSGQVEELPGGLDASQPIFEILGNAQSCSVPGRELADQDAGVRIVLFVQQLKVPHEKAELLVDGRLWRRRRSGGNRCQLAENPGIKHCAASDRDSGAAGCAQHVQCIARGPDIAIADDRNAIHRLHDRADSIQIDMSVESLLSGPAVNRDGDDPQLLEFSPVPGPSVAWSPSPASS